MSLSIVPAVAPSAAASFVPVLAHEGDTTLPPCALPNLMGAAGVHDAPSSLDSTKKSMRESAGVADCHSNQDQVASVSFGQLEAKTRVYVAGE